MAAVTYLQALVIEGDTWQKLSPEQVKAAMSKVPDEQREPGLHSVLMDTDRLQRVANALTCAEDARAFSWVWGRMPNI